MRLPTTSWSRLPFVCAVFVMLAAGALTRAGPASAATLVVKNTNNAGPNSLRAAVMAANADPASDRIRFAIPGTGGHVITLTTPLPTITQPVVIDGRSQPGFAGSPLIQIDNGTGDTSAVGLDFEVDSSKVLALSVTHFGTGIRFRAGDGNRVAGSWIGIDLAGVQAANYDGILITGSSSSNVIGGTDPADRNLIGGNNVAGVSIDGDGTTKNLVEGNYIGAVLGATPNFYGAELSGGTTGNHVGGTGAGQGNVISGNSRRGVDLEGAGTTGNAIQGNLIGTSPSGRRGLGNEVGIWIDDHADANTIGGTTAGAGNVVSAGTEGIQVFGSKNLIAGNDVGTDVTGSQPLGNSSVGIQVVGSANTIGGTTAAARNVVAAEEWGIAVDGSKNTVEGNYVGVDAAGTAPLRNAVGIYVHGAGTTIGGTDAGAGNVVSGNAGDGIEVDGGGVKIEGNLIGPDPSGTVLLGNGGNGVAFSKPAADNVVGGTAAAAANTIAGNVGWGVLVDGTGGSANGNAILGNPIYLDGGGISFKSGGNDSQPPPGIASVTSHGAKTDIAVNVYGKPSAVLRVEVFASPVCTAPDFGAGKEPLAAVSAPIGASGQGSVTVSVPKLPSDTGVSATATNNPASDGLPRDTSPFSPCVAAP